MLSADFLDRRLCVGEVLSPPDDWIELLLIGATGTASSFAACWACFLPNMLSNALTRLLRRWCAAKEDLRPCVDFCVSELLPLLWKLCTISRMLFRRDTVAALRELVRELFSWSDFEVERGAGPYESCSCDKNRSFLEAWSCCHWTQESFDRSDTLEDDIVLLESRSVCCFRLKR